MTDTGAAAPAAPTKNNPETTVTTVNDSPHDKRVFWLGVGIVTVVLIVIILLFFVTIPTPNKDVLNTVIGVLVGTGFGSVVGYYFGTSSSSKAKDETISTLLLPTPPPVAPAPPAHPAA
jgi:hypothetical protein